MHHRHHSNRHLKRHILDWLLVLVIALGSFLIAVNGYYRYGVYSQTIMSESVSESEYYDEQYDKFEQELNLFLDAIGVPAEVVNEGQDLRSWYSFELRKKVLTEDKEGAFSDGIRDKIEMPVRTYLYENNILLSDEAELGFANMLQSLEANLTEEINHPDIQRWYAEREAFEADTGLSTFLGAAAAVLAAVILFLIQHYWYRAVYYTGTGVLCGGLMSAAYILYLRFGAGTGEADGTLQSLSIYHAKVLETGCLIAALCIGLGIFLMIAERVIRRYHAG